jgi:putative oxidoreductase
MLSTFFFYGGLGVFVLRVVLGAIFIVHGWPKIKNLKATAMNFGGMGFRPGIFWGTIVAVLEFAGGIALVLGAFTQAVAALFVLEFVVILIWRITKGNPFVHGWEFDLLILAALLVLFFNGGGSYSFDRSYFIGW